MTAVLTWFKAERWRLSFSHCITGLIIQLPMTLLLGHWGGAASVVVWFWSRKKLEMEFKAGRTPEDVTKTWTAGFFPWQWPRVYVFDVLYPAITSFAIAYLISRGLK